VEDQDKDGSEADDTLPEKYRFEAFQRLKGDLETAHRQANAYKLLYLSGIRK
jgi:hypothetical protein